MQIVIDIPEDSYKATCDGCMLPPDVKSVVNAIKNGTQLQEQPKWIPVSDRLPKEGQYVLCQCQANIYDVLKLTIDGWYHDKNNCYMSGFVIAWMPLPEPYEEAEEKEYDEDDELVESLLNDFEGTLERIDKQNN